MIDRPRSFDFMTRALGFVFLIHLFGCAVPVETMPASFLLNGKDASIVFGHLIIDSTPDHMIRSLEQPDGMTLTLQNQSSGKTYEITSEGAGKTARFFVPLPPGPYRVRQWSKGRATIPLRGSFEIARGRAGYLGTVTWTPGRSASPSGALEGTITIEDRFEEERRLFNERYPRIDAPVVRSIITPY